MQCNLMHRHWKTIISLSIKIKCWPLQCENHLKHYLVLHFVPVGWNIQHLLAFSCSGPRGSCCWSLFSNGAGGWIRDILHHRVDVCRCWSCLLFLHGVSRHKRLPKSFSNAEFQVAVSVQKRHCILACSNREVIVIELSWTFYHLIKGQNLWRRPLLKSFSAFFCACVFCKANMTVFDLRGSENSGSIFPAPHPEFCQSKVLGHKSMMKSRTLFGQRCTEERWGLSAETRWCPSGRGLSRASWRREEGWWWTGTAQVGRRIWLFHQKTSPITLFVVSTGSDHRCVGVSPSSFGSGSLLSRQWPGAWTKRLPYFLSAELEDRLCSTHAQLAWRIPSSQPFLLPQRRFQGTQSKSTYCDVHSEDWNHLHFCPPVWYAFSSESHIFPRIFFARPAAVIGSHGEGSASQS